MDCIWHVGFNCRRAMTVLLLCSVHVVLPTLTVGMPLCTADGDEASQGCACSQERLDLAARACAAEEEGTPQGVLGAQHLFSVYVHPLPEFGAFPASSIFAGHEIAHRIEVRASWHAPTGSLPVHGRCRVCTL